MYQVKSSDGKNLLLALASETLKNLTDSVEVGHGPIDLPITARTLEALALSDPGDELYNCLIAANFLEIPMEKLCQLSAKRISQFTDKQIHGVIENRIPLFRYVKDLTPYFSYSLPKEMFVAPSHPLFYCFTIEEFKRALSITYSSADIMISKYWMKWNCKILEFVEGYPIVHYGDRVYCIMGNTWHFLCGVNCRSQLRVYQNYVIYGHVIHILQGGYWNFLKLDKRSVPDFWISDGIQISDGILYANYQDRRLYTWDLHGVSCEPLIRLNKKFIAVGRYYILLSDSIMDKHNELSYPLPEPIKKPYLFHSPTYQQDFFVDQRDDKIYVYTIPDYKVVAEFSEDIYYFHDTLLFYPTMIGYSCCHWLTGRSIFQNIPITDRIIQMGTEKFVVRFRI